MSDRELKAKITGSVDPSVAAAFRTVTDGSAKMGTAVDQAGKKSSASLRDMGKATDESRARYVAFGAAVGTMASILSNAARASEESAQIQRQLQQSIENTGESYASYADEISAAGERAVQLGIDDEKAMQAIQALTESTGSARVALNQLGLAQDLSAAKGMDLVTSAELIGKVLNGNVGILARYGISVDKGATSTEALAQIQAQVAGQAEAHASQLDIWKVKLDNINESVGAALGDFAPFIGMLPGLSVGFSAASAAGGAFIDVLKNSAVASKALTFALGPGGLLTAGAALAAVGVYKVWTAVDQYDEAVRRTLGPTEDFAAALEMLGSTGAAQALQVQSWGVAFQKSVNDSKEIIEAYGADIAPGIQNVEDALKKIGTAVGPGAAQARADTQLWIDQLDEIGISGAGPAIIVIADNLDIYDSNALKAASSTIALSGAMVQQSAVTDSLAKAMGDIAVGYEDTAAGQKVLSDLQLIATEGTIRQREHVAALLQSYKDEINTYEVVAFSIDAVADSVRKEDAAFKAASESGAKYSQSLIDGMTAQADAAAARNVVLEEGHRLINNAQFGRPQDAFDYEGDAQKAKEYYDIVADGEAERRSELSKTITVLPKLGEIISQDMLPDVTYIPGLADALWDLGHAGETSMDRLARGSTSAAVALSAFKEIQDGIISGQGGFNDQISEYGQQLNYITEAEELLNQRREEGIAITAEQAEFLRRADAAQGDLQGGIEDSTIALGMQALQYAENIRVGGEMNAALGENTSATGALVDIVRDLILSMEGVPEEIRTKLELDGVSTAFTQLEAYQWALGNLHGRTVQTYIHQNIQTSGGILSGIQYRHGGVVEPQWPTPNLHARDGLATPGGARFIRMNEAGGEDVIVPGGSFIRNAAASAEARGRSRGRGDGAIIVNTLILHPASPDIYSEIRSRALSGR